MSEARTTTSYVAQYQGYASELATWIDLSVKPTPEEAFGRLDEFRAAWDALNRLESHPVDVRVVRRVITDTVIADSRPAPEAEEAKAVSG
jgi:hypothetical protein